MAHPSDRRISVKQLQHRLPVRDDVTQLTYHRNPTESEVRFGHGATHYRDFPVEDCCFPKSRVPKRWFVAADDGLRYYR